MSRILRRPMFRGGRVDSRGTGITTGLDRPGMQGGGMPPASGSIMTRGGLGGTRTPFRPPMVINPGGVPMVTNTSRTYSRPIGPPRGGLSGGTMGSRLLSKAMNIPYVGKAMRPLFGGLGGGGTLMSGAAGLYGGAGLAGMGLGQLADFYARGSSTPEGYARLKEMSGPGFNFDETNIDVGDVLAYIDEGNQMGEKYGFFPRGGPEQRLKDLGLEDKFTPEGDRIELPEVLDDLTKNNNKGGAGTGGAGGDDDPKRSTEESLEIDKEKFAKLLGSDRAKGQDIADMLLSFSSKALAPEADVKSAFAEFAADEVKRPSRVQKIDD